jgi:RNA polymerase sigma-70 factor (ECF subfamily)
MPRPPWIPGNCSWPSTEWSLVRAAACPREAGRAALENLCRRYWYPIYAFIRRKWTPAGEAEDLTQAFFVHVLKNGVLAAADPQKGSFKGFLRIVCRNFLINQGEIDGREVLNGVLSLDALRDGAGRFALEPPAPDPEAWFEVDWAFDVLTNALEAVRRRYARRGYAEIFDSLRAYLPLHDGESPPASRGG